MLVRGLPCWRSQLLQTGREYGHRDLCLFYGFVDAAHYAYVHLATTPDANAHNVFLVDGADRRPLASIPAEGVDWGTDEWHRVRVERAGTQVRVFFDRAPDPLFVVEDPTSGVGRVGVGSFDDTGRFAELVVWAAEVYPPEGASTLSD